MWAVSPRERSETPPLLRTSKMVMELWQGKMGSIINRSKFSGVLDDLLGRVLEGLLLGLLEVIIYMLEEYVISKAL